MSPLLANIYLNELDQFIARQWADLTDTERMRQRRRKVARPCFIVRYADDFAVFCESRTEAEETIDLLNQGMAGRTRTGTLAREDAYRPRH